MPGHIPPGGPFHQGRKQMDPYQYYVPPPQAHSPVYHNPYAPYHHPQHYGPPHGYPQQMPHMQQWNPYHQPQPQPQPQYNMPPRQFQPHASPVVVSSHPHMAGMPPVNRSLGQTPPIVHSHTPPVQRVLTPHRVPSSPSVHSQVQTHSPTPPAHTTIASPPPVADAKPVHVASPPSPQPTTFTPYYPPLPWLSVPDADFPARAAGRRRRKRGLVPAQEQGLALPSREQDVHEDATAADQTTAGELESAGEPEDSQASTIAVPSDAEVDTPSTSHPPSEVDAPSVHQAAAQTAAPAQKHARNATKPAVPLIPIKPAKAASAASATQKSATSPPAEKPQPKAIDEIAASAPEAADVEETSKPAAPVAPKSWAELLRAKNAAAAPQAPTQPQPPVTSNGVVSTNGPVAPKSNSLADVLASYSVDAEKKVSFIEPRGLVNTGNLCYMNSVLQRAVHSFKSETPLVDAMIMFLRDFKVIDSASSVEQLRLRLKTDELEQYGDPLTPEYVYETIRRLPRFDNMKRGSQEDAEEFLGFLLAGLHDDCALVIKKGKAAAAQNGTSSKTEQSDSADGEWLEVTAKQKTSVTQSSGTVEVETPITKIFGGKLRSEYRKAGQKPSVTFEPYQPLQLDIGEPHINNISDALKNLTRLETLDSAASGARASTKQVHIETLPPVLILHLKRFHYDKKGPQKIWKKIGYPLELEIPKEAFPQHKRGGYQAQGGFPRYRLTGVVYHHGKNASGGHYTVDLRRQEGREWIRMDDTVIRRIRAEDVAEGGAEEDPKLLAAALEQHKNDSGKSKNFFAQIDVDDEASDKGGWNQVNGADKKDSTKKWAGVVNGTATPNSAGKRTPLPKENVRDNKVAYILFYQRIES
ncbi:hypothetical protein E8E13_003916 [Curvularia kusanoi]|uniref:Ubiquitin carboxyl-terminal hydrolase n=1 Tax=Curvularia kusanoi TaxID=90978 RepID=A0A9P4TB07_CURKU|nr:hypothetical protein E8E13_003916 [Curvularia kusanoi]